MKNKLLLSLCVATLALPAIAQAQLTPEKRVEDLEKKIAALEKRVQHNHEMTGEEFMTQRHLREARIRPIEIYFGKCIQRIDRKLGFKPLPFTTD